MYFTIKITETDKQIIEEVLKIFKKVVNEAVTNSLKSIKDRVGILIKDLIVATPEYESITKGQLQLDLGLTQPEAALKAILDKLAENIEINFSPLRVKGEELEGNLKIGMIRGNFSDILNLPESSYYSNKNKIPWLQWLLIKGDSVIIANYSVKYFNRPVSGSNTHEALMIHSKNKTGWRVPSQFSGTIDDNFITRAFTNNPATEELIGKILEEEITSRFH